MSVDEVLKCVIAFILGWLISRHMGNGFSVGGDEKSPFGWNHIDIEKPCNMKLTDAVNCHDYSNMLSWTGVDSSTREKCNSKLGITDERDDEGNLLYKNCTAYPSSGTNMFMCNNRTLPCKSNEWWQKACTTDTDESGVSYKPLHELSICNKYKDTSATATKVGGDGDTCSDQDSCSNCLDKVIGKKLNRWSSNTPAWDYNELYDQCQKIWADITLEELKSIDKKNCEQSQLTSYCDNKKQHAKDNIPASDPKTAADI